MQRKQLVVGDPPAGGGRILPFDPPFKKMICGHQVAIIGGRVHCQACGSVGIIAKAGGPRRMGYITEVALEGDLCVCRCPEPQPLLSTLQNLSSMDDEDFGRQPGIPLWTRGSDHHLVSRKLVDEEVQHPPEAKQTESICPNITNTQFSALMMELRDEAVTIVGLRLKALERWDKAAQAHILEWFGDPGFGSRTNHLNDLRVYLAKGMVALERVLRGLAPKNFIRWSTSSHDALGCFDDRISTVGLAAQVCAPDVQTRTIAIALEFCGLRRTSRIFGTDKFTYSDSQLQVLIHEVTHFNDVFASTDAWYGMRLARETIEKTGNTGKARANADSIVGYIMGAQDL